MVPRRAKAYALPHAWPSGRVTGLRARGGFTVDMTWKDGALEEALLTAGHDGEIRVRSRVPLTVTPGGMEVASEQGAKTVVEFLASAGRTYRLCSPSGTKTKTCQIPHDLIG